MASGAVLVHDVSLEPGDRILLYSDGVVESRDEAGEEFGLQRFTDHIIRLTAAGQSAPEVLRKSRKAQPWRRRPARRVGPRR